MEERIERAIIEDKTIRKALDETLQLLKSYEGRSRERSLSMTKIQEAIMWLGMDLEILKEGESFYVISHNPENTTVDPIFEKG